MSKVVQQAIALTQIRRLVEQDFTREPYFLEQIIHQVMRHVELEPGQEITYDEETKWYKVHTFPLCKICNATQKLIEIPTQHSQFHLCPSCYKDITRVKEEK